MLLYHFVKLLSRLVCLLPLKIRLSIGNVLGEFCWLLVPVRRKKLATENIMLSLHLDKQAAKHIAKKSATRFGRMFIEVLSFPLLNKGNIGNKATLIGLEHVREALGYGRGVVLAAAHSGNWELMANILALHDLPLVSVAQKQTNQAMDTFINEYRTMFGAQVTYKTGVRDMIRFLGEGKMIGLIMDQDAGDKGAFVDFFGRPASTATGAAALARLKDAPIVPIFITETSPGEHTIIMHEIVKPEKTLDRDADLLVVTEKLTKIIEDHIRSHPHEWFWLHNRWKHKPKP
ncbi:MAG: lysophospholipid acyltransferase family protein [Pelosinus sp.]|nr:lysophospholipid acyltransferase family protein [Pelosinus sp.]